MSKRRRTLIAVIPYADPHRDSSILYDGGRNLTPVRIAARGLEVFMSG